MSEPRRVTFLWRKVFIYWLLVIVFICTFPWFVGPAQLQTVTWVPFTDLYSARRIVDAVANCMLYLPLGFCYMQIQVGTKRTTSIVEAGLLAILLAGSCELYQIFSPLRYPTMTDVVMNILGSLLGASIGSYFQGRRLVLVFER